MELSLAGLIGAMIGTLLGAINYAMIVSFVVRALRANDTSQTAAERDAFETRISVLRRAILGADIAICAGVGYWFGKTIAGG
jgi:hypothetical protein